MIVVSIEEAKRDFARVLDHVTAGEEVVIASEDREIAVVSPVTKAIASPRPRNRKRADRDFAELRRASA